MAPVAPSRRAYRYITVGGKTFFFNIAQSKIGQNYVTIVGRRGADNQSDEKLTLFPNQVGSFLHCYLETYAEVCRREGIHNYLAAPFMIHGQVDKSLEEPPTEEEVLEMRKEGTSIKQTKEGKYRSCPGCGRMGEEPFLPMVEYSEPGRLFVWCIASDGGCGYKWPKQEGEGPAVQSGPAAEAYKVFDEEWLKETHGKWKL